VSANSVEPPRIIVVVPTRNRWELLEGLLMNLSELEIIPTRAMVIDSSDQRPDIHLKELPFPCDLLWTNLNSAAKQRNFGLRTLRESNEVYDYIAFLDDDVRIERKYFNDVCQTFKDFPKAIGVSGVAKVAKSETKTRRRNWFTDLIGLTGEPCSITSAVINIPPASDGINDQAEWLIGCSTWRAQLLDDDIYFEEDFTGQSIFEDVIFSWRCRKRGNLVCNSKIVLQHLFSSLNRPNNFEFYRSWTRNRYRLFRYEAKKSRVHFWILHGLNTALSIITSLSFKKGSFKKLMGLTAGGMDILSGRK
jgi:hypothetical protein